MIIGDLTTSTGFSIGAGIAKNITEFFTFPQPEWILTPYAEEKLRALKGDQYVNALKAESTKKTSVLEATVGEIVKPVNETLKYIMVVGAIVAVIMIVGVIRGR